jgi:chaperonin GroEL
MAKLVTTGDESRSAVLRGVNTLADAVVATLGPRGRQAAFERPYGPPVITKDGVSVANEILLPDPVENMGAQLVRAVAGKTGDVAGDGTTTAVLLARAIYREGVRNVTAGASPCALKVGIDKAVAVVVSALRDLSTDVTVGMIPQVGTISANGDQHIGSLLAEAMERVGKDGVITVDESKALETILEVVEGMQFDRGLVSPHFVTNPERMECVLEDVRILICERKLGALKELMPVLNSVAGQGKPLLIIAEDIEGEALATLVVNRVRGTLPCAAVKAPGFGDRRKAMLEDIAILTGGTAITNDLGIHLTNVKLEDLGFAAKVIITHDTTTIIGGAGQPDAIKTRVELLRAQLEGQLSDYDREKTHERLAKLSGGVAVIRLGAATEVELKEKKDRVEDAMHATRAAVEEGIVPGGGVALLRCIPALDKLKLSGDEAVGVNIVKHVLAEPLRQIVNNAGLDASVIVNRVRRSKSPDFGFNAATGTYGNLVKAGVIDPTKVTRLALQNAASVAGLALTTNVWISEIRKEENSNGRNSNN